jgi:hypothetical protein
MWWWIPGFPTTWEVDAGVSQVGQPGPQVIETLSQKQNRAGA